MQDLIDKIDAKTAQFRDKQLQASIDVLKESLDQFQSLQVSVARRRMSACQKSREEALKLVEGPVEERLEVSASFLFISSSGP